MSPSLYRPLVLAFLLASGCVRMPVQLSSSTRHLEGPQSIEILGPARGKACQFNLFYLIPIGGNQLWKAKERAIENADGLVDVSVDSAMALAIIGTVACTEVRGQRYRLTSEPPPAPQPTVIREEPTEAIREEAPAPDSPGDEPSSPASAGDDGESPSTGEEEAGEASSTGPEEPEEAPAEDEEGQETPPEDGESAEDSSSEGADLPEE